MNFNNYDWHDSIITNIVIDRNNPGVNDTVLLDIIWANDERNTICFKDVYWANFDMNFGIVIPENILNAYLLKSHAKILKDFYLRWRGLVDSINLNCYVIELNSTGSNIKIIANSTLLK